MFGCWLGYELNWIRERREFYAGSVAKPVDPFEKTAPPGLLWLFGELGHQIVGVEVGSAELAKMTAEDRSRCRRAKVLFPEANIITLDKTTGAVGRFY